MKKILCLFFVLALTACGKTPHPQTLLLNGEGVALHQQQNYQAALDKYIEALRYDPFQGELHLNMGLAFEALEQSEKAQQSYHLAQELGRNPRTLFMAYFNEAQLLGKAKKVDEALALYQRALEINPTSKEAKTNIELLTQDQQGQGGGKGDQQKDPKDSKDQNKDKGQGKDKQDKGDDKDSKDSQDGQKEDKTYKNTPKYQPRKFEGKDLSETDVKKILGELRQQEQKIRAEFNRKDVKEQPRGKDW